MPSARRRLRAVAGVGAALLALSAPGGAHETWLLPTDSAPPDNRSVEFTLTSGMRFPEPGSGIDPVRIVDATLLQDGDAQALVPTRTREGALELTAKRSSGVACGWVSLRPRVLTFESDDDVTHYLEEVGAPQSVWDAWRRVRGRVVWRESYSKLARTYLAGRSGTTAEPCWNVRAGARFDIVPLSDPTTLSAGDTLQLQVLFDDEPLAGQAIGFVREGARPETLVRSDDKGRVTLTMTAPGRHMVYATNLRRVDNDAYAWESDFTTLTFLVGER